MVSHLVYSDCTFEDQDEGSAQAPRFPSFVKNCPASAHFWALAYISSSWGKVAVFHQSTLSFHCVFDELCPGFCLEASNQQTFYCDYQGLMLLCSVQDLPVTIEHQQGNFYGAAWELWDCSLRKQPASWKTLRSCSCSHTYWPQPCGSSCFAS